MKRNQKPKPKPTPQRPFPEVQPPITTSTPEESTYQLYIEHQKQAWADCQSGSDEFDKSILTYSSAGLGVSLVFLKDIVPLPNAVGLGLLYASWVSFGVAILVTVFSFQLSVMSQEKHLEHLREYYLEGKTESLNAPNKAASWVGWLKWVSGLCFVLAMIGTITFSIWNLVEAKDMSENKTKGGPVALDEGRKPMSMTPLEKGRKPMAMTPLPSNSAPQQPAQPPASSTTAKQGKK